MKPQRRIVTLMTVLFFILGMVALAPPGGAAQSTDNVTVTDTATSTEPSNATDTATESETATATATDTATVTEAVMETATETETVTQTATITETATAADTTTPTKTETATVTETPTETEASILLAKLFCQAFNEQAAEEEDPCIGRVEEAEGTSVGFVLNNLDNGDVYTVDIPIEEFEGDTIGARHVIGFPYGTYLISEEVPAGYDAFAVETDDSQQAEGATLTLDVGDEEPLALFVNVPFAEETPPATTEQQTPAVIPTEPQVPVVPPVAGVTTLLSTGDGSSAGTGWALWLALAAAPLLLGAASGVQRRSRR